MTVATRTILRGMPAAAAVALAGISMPLLAAAALTVLAVVMAVCWTITDADRSDRLTALIQACRGNIRQIAPGASRPATLATTPDASSGQPAPRHIAISDPSPDHPHTSH